ncbi:MAG: GNAT family N-acetyltransferase [Spirochaetales bacterium]|nr:GNAT family N-acetyltransferase [Spirochaetales bacterium]
MSLTARLGKKRPQRGRAGDGKIWCRVTPEHQVNGVLFLSRSGVVIPTCDEITHQDQQELTPLLHSFFPSLFSFMGTRSTVLQLEAVMKEAPPDAQDYRLLVLKNPVAKPARTEPNIMVRQATLDDLNQIWPLEREYYDEEVLRQGRTLSKSVGIKMLRNTLEQQVVYCVLYHNQIIAKANTNARGRQFDQIGGVFVPPSLRGKSLGRLVMNALLSHIASENRSACLFVKKDNTPALSLYHGLGFEDQGAFRINYWR